MINKAHSINFINRNILVRSAPKAVGCTPFNERCIYAAILITAFLATHLLSASPACQQRCAITGCMCWQTLSSS